MGQIGRVPFVGLPGNPVAVMVTFFLLARPLMLLLAGANDPGPELYRVRAGFDYKKRPNRTEYVRARLVRDNEGGWIAEKFARDGAGILTSIGRKRRPRRDRRRRDQDRARHAGRFPALQRSDFLVVPRPQGAAVI